MKSFATALLGGSLFCSSLLAFAQMVPAPERQNVVQLSATGSLEIEQDWLTMRLTTTREGADPLWVQSQLKVALDGALEQARRLTQPGQVEVRTGPFGLQPRYARDGKLSGWQGTAELLLEGRDMARISALAGRIQTMTLGQVSFGLSREQRVKSEAEAQRLAIEQFKAKAGEIARGFGFAGYSLREVAVHSDASGPTPRLRAMAMAAQTAMAEAPVPIEAGKTLVQVVVSGSIQMK